MNTTHIHPMSALSPEGEVVITIALHDDCGVVVVRSVEELTDGVAHCTKCGDHFDAPAPDADVFAWAASQLASA